MGRRGRSRVFCSDRTVMTERTGASRDADRSAPEWCKGSVRRSFGWLGAPCPSVQMESSSQRRYTYPPFNIAKFKN